MAAPTAAPSSPSVPDTIEPLSHTNTASTHVAKHEATVTVDSADPMNLGRHRRSNISKAQLKADHPQANTRRMKVCRQVVLL